MKRQKLRDKLTTREFQIELAKIQTLADSTNSFFTTMIAVAITWIATTFTLSFADVINPEINVNLLESAVLMILLLFGIAIFFIALNYSYVPKRLSKLKK